MTSIGMKRIVGLDTSLTATGIGVITRRVDGSCIATTTVVTSRGKRGDNWSDRESRIRALAAQVLAMINPAALIVIEAPFNSGTRGGSPLDRFGLFWRIKHGLTDRGIPTAVCVTTTLKRFATGNGNADKAAVAVAMIRAWPSWEPESSRTTNDEGDALALAHAGAVWLGWDVTTLQRHRDALDGIAWPDRPVGEVEVPVPMTPMTPILTDS